MRNRSVAPHEYVIFARKRGVRVENASRVAMYDADIREVVRVSDVDPSKMQRADAERGRKSKVLRSGAGFSWADGQ